MSRPAPEKTIPNFRILPYCRYVSWHLAGLFLVSIIIAGMFAVNTYLMKIVYDSVYPGHDRHLLLIVCLVLGGCIVCIIIFNILKQMILVRIRHILVEKIRLSLLELVNGYEYGYFLKTGSSELMKRLTIDAEAIVEGVSQTVTGLTNTVVILIWLVVFLNIVPWVALVYAFLAGFLFAWVMVWRKPHQQRASGISLGYERLFRLIWKAIGGIKMVKCEILHERMYDELDTVMGKLKKSFTDTMNIGQAIWSVLFPLPWLAFVFVMFMGYHAIQAGDLTLGALTFCLWFIWRFVEPMAEMNRIVIAHHDAALAKKRIGSLLTGTMECGGSRTFTGIADSIEFRNVSCRYDGSAFSLNNVNLVLRRGKSMALIGRTGCGKSSLVHILLRLFNPAAGSISCDGTPLGEFSITSVRDGITLVPQDITLYATTLRRNIDIRGTLADNEICHLLEQLMLGPWLDNLPDGLDTDISGSIPGLSGGEKKRLGIARALALNSSVYVFDEITANIDPETERQVLDTILSRRKNMTALFITHNLDLLSRMDDVALIANDTVRILEPHEKEQGIERILALYDITGA